MITFEIIIAILTIGVSFLTFIISQDYFRYIVLFVGMWDIELSFYMSKILNKKVAIKRLQYVAFNLEHKIGENHLVIDHKGTYYYIIFNEQEYSETLIMTDFSGVDCPFLLYWESFLSYCGLSGLLIVPEWISILCLRSFFTTKMDMDKIIAKKLDHKDVTLVYMSKFPKKSTENGDSVTDVSHILDLRNFKMIDWQNQYFLVANNGENQSMFLNELNIEKYAKDSAALPGRALTFLSLPPPSGKVARYRFLAVLVEQFVVTRGIDAFFLVYLFMIVLGPSKLEMLLNTKLSDDDVFITLVEYSRFLDAVSDCYGINFVILSDIGLYRFSTNCRSNAKVRYNDDIFIAIPDSGRGIQIVSRGIVEFWQPSIVNRKSKDFKFLMKRTHALITMPVY